MRQPNWGRMARFGMLAWAAVLLACAEMMQPGVAHVPSAAQIEAANAERDYDDRVRQHGDSVKFVFTQPEGATYTIDGRDYKMPAQVSLTWRRDRQYSLSVKIDKQVYNGEIQVLRTNAGTKMGLITVDQITTEQLKSEVDRGEPFRVRFDVLKESVAEIRLGNRGEIAKDTIKLTIPGIEIEVDRERELATEQEKEWSRWTKLAEYSVPDGMKEKIRKAEDSLKRANDLKDTRVEDAADAYEEARKIYGEQLKNAQTENAEKNRLNRAREGATDAQESWNLWWSHNPDPKIPDAVDKATDEFSKGEKSEFDGKMAPATEAFNKASELYLGALKESGKTPRAKTVDQAKAEAAAYKDAWTKWREGKPLKKDPLDISKAPAELEKADKYADEKKEKPAVQAYEMARERYRRGLEEAKGKTQEERTAVTWQKQAEAQMSDWMDWEKRQKPAETEQIRKAKGDMEEAGKRAAAGDFREAGDLYRNTGLVFDREFKTARDKARSGGYKTADVSVDRSNPRPTPCDAELSHRTDNRSYNGTLEFNKQKYYLSFRVLDVTEFTRISKVVLRNITQRVLRQAAGGKPSIITYRLDDKPVLELAIGNRPPE